jgi:hypothetical protein
MRAVRTKPAALFLPYDRSDVITAISSAKRGKEIDRAERLKRLFDSGQFHLAAQAIR